MDFYVVAFTGNPMPRRRIGGRWYEAVRLDGVWAVGERRQHPPEATDLELKHQHDVVVQLAERFDAILPVRFGGMTSRASLAEMPERLRVRLAEGLEEVRGRTQMTIRFIGEPQAARSVSKRPASGRAYLAERRAATIPALPSEAEAWLDTLRPLVARERIERGTGSVLATVYHLVRTRDVGRYTKRASDGQAVAARVTGPFPPFAFTPSIL